MNPRELKAGELWDDGTSYMTFIDEANEKGVKICLVFRGGIEKPWISEKRQTKTYYYSKLLGHDAFAPFDSKWAKEYWEFGRGVRYQFKGWKKVATLPALIGQKGIKIELPLK